MRRDRSEVGMARRALDRKPSSRLGREASQLAGGLKLGDTTSTTPAPDAATSPIPIAEPTTYTGEGAAAGTQYLLGVINSKKRSRKLSSPPDPSLGSPVGPSTDSPIDPRLILNGMSGPKAAAPHTPLQSNQYVESNPLPPHTPPTPTRTGDVNWASSMVDDILNFTWDPLGYTRYAYTWGEGELSSAHSLYEWQSDVLNQIGLHLRNPATRHTPLRIAVSSGKGIGKSALISMICQWGLSTCDDTKVTVTANTEPQLRTKTWPEINKWARAAINADWFNMGATSVTSADPKHSKTWRADAVTWSEENTQAFAGLHNQGKRIIVIFDEASEIADSIWDVAEGALTDANTEIIWIAFGNPTKNIGRFADCFSKLAHRWLTRRIDSRTVSGTNKVQIKEWVDDYGEDSDFVRIWVKGEFPRTASEQFIPSDAVEMCKKYKAAGYTGLAKILSVDVARFGKNKSVIGWRQGRKFVIYKHFQGADTHELSREVVQAIDRLDPDGVVIDGDGVGGGVIDNVKAQGLTYKERVFEFHAQARAYDTVKYYNRRTEVWGLGREWIKNGGELPDIPTLHQDLIAPQYGYSGKQQLQLERKDDMEKRGLESPDFGDCFVMTFALPNLKPRQRNWHESAIAPRPASCWN